MSYFRFRRIECFFLFVAQKQTSQNFKIVNTQFEFKNWKNKNFFKNVLFVLTCWRSETKVFLIAPMVWYFSNAQLLHFHLFARIEKTLDLKKKTIFSVYFFDNYFDTYFFIIILKKFSSVTLWIRLNQLSTFVFALSLNFSVLERFGL